MAYAAPFLEQFSSIVYGKRKTWFIVSLSFTSSVVFVSSFFTDLKYDNLFAVLCILAQFGMAFLDISTHASMVKELKSPAQASIILCYGQTVGGLLGGLLMMKLTSLEFASSIGLTKPITTPQTLLAVYSVALFVPIMIVHFYFKERTLESEKRGSRFSFCEIISYYSVFLNTSSRYFRICLFFLLYQQGFNFFNALYDYNLVQAGFSRDTSNTIGNIIVFPVILMTFYYARLTNLMGGKAKTTVILFLLLIAINLYLLIVFPLNPWAIAITGLLGNVFSSWYFYISAWMIN